MNCAFYDKSTKLCAQLEYTFKNITGYRDIANLTHNRNNSVILKMATNDRVNLRYYFLKETHAQNVSVSVFT